MNEQLTYSVASACLVAATGIVPLLFVPTNGNDGTSGKSQRRDSSGWERRLRLLLSFAVGSVLGDVFFHLLPESFAFAGADHNDLTLQGLAVLGGIVVFFAIEKFCLWTELRLSLSSNDEPSSNNNNRSDFSKEQAAFLTTSISGYLNLLANFMDNLTHGIAVAGSFLLSNQRGVLTTLAIIVHEVPHEFGDFAILMRAGFGKWSAAAAQMATSIGAVCGVFLTFWCKNIDAFENLTSLIIPFTAGGFLYIALVTVLPELVTEDNQRNSVSQLLLIFLGTSVMFVATSLIG